MTQLRLRYLAIILLMAGAVFGQLVRLEIVPGSRIAVTAADLVIILTSIGLLFSLIRYRQIGQYARLIYTHFAWRFLALFLAWALASLLVNSSHLASNEILVGLAYWLRLTGFAFVLTSLSFYLKSEDEPRVIRYFSIFSLAAVLAGFYQLMVAPDFAFLAVEGWDPHSGRLLSTFFDPNFFAAFLVLVMTITLGYDLQSPAGRQRHFYRGIFILAWLALYFTFSRSGWLMGFLAVPWVAWFASKRLSFLLAAMFIVVALLPTRLGSRLQQSASFLNTASVIDGGDPSAAARAISNVQAWKLGQEHWLTGVGYNVYGYALDKSGLAPSERLDERSGMGADNSWLFIFATTGVIGLALFAAYYWGLLRLLWQERKESKLARPLFLFFISAAFGTIFNNLLFYPPLILALIVPLAWSQRPDSPSPEPSNV